MFKIVESIVDTHRKLIGFTIEGKESEFGGFSANKIRKNVTIASLAGIHFDNSQLKVEATGQLVEKGNFKINELPMKVLVNNNFVSVPNSIEILGRYAKDNKIIGYDVGFGDKSTGKYTYNNVVQLSYWFKPTNFVIRKSARRRTFISSKPGCTNLDELPIHYLDNAKAKSNNIQEQKPQEQHIQEKKTQDKPKNQLIDEKDIHKDGVFDNGVDLIDICEALDRCGGLILKLPNETYIKSTVERVKTSENFTALGLGEYAYPKIEFSGTKLNASVNFRKPGMVPIEFGPGAKMPIQSFTYKKKSIFINAENYIERLGVAVPKSYEQNLLDSFGQTMGLKEITDKTMTQAVSALTSKPDLVFYELDTNKIDLIQKDKLDDYILNLNELNSIVRKYFSVKAVSKYLSPRTGLVAELKKALKTDYKEASGKQPIALYSAMSAEIREKISESGIDIYSGAYLKTSKVEDIDQKEVERAKQKEDTSVGIDYCIKGLEINKWTYKRLKAEGSKEKSSLPVQVLNVIKTFENTPNSVDKMIKAFKLFEAYEKKEQELKNTLWLHKCAMYLKSNKTSIHQHDKDEWEQDTTRKTKASIYNCKKAGCEGLMVAVSNSRI